jgi:hypothetical protein
VLVHKDGRLPPELAALWTHPTLLAIAQQLLVSRQQSVAAYAWQWSKWPWTLASFAVAAYLVSAFSMRRLD